MIGRSSRTTSPSRSTTRRSTPWVAGWWGPTLTVITSLVRSTVPSVIVLFRVGERHRLAANWEIPSLRPAHVVVGHQDPCQIRVPPEHNPEEIEHFPLLGFGSWKYLHA